MKKHYLLTVLLAMMATFVTAQDEHKRIQLTEDDANPVTVDFDYCKLYVSAIGQDDNVSVSIEIENTNSAYLFLFPHAYSVKDLKKQKPSIRFGKRSAGISKSIITCQGSRGDEIIRIDPDRKRSLRFDRSGQTAIELPIYIANHKPKKFLSSEKYIIEERALITLDIDYKKAEPEDDTYDKLNEEYESIIEDLKKTGICTRSYHPVSQTKQKTPFEERIQEVLDEISDLKKKNKWNDRSKEYKPYKELKAQLEEIDFKEYEKWCGNCRPAARPTPSPTPSPGHRCSYCDKSLDGVLRTLMRAYNRIDTGTSKSSVMGEVNALHRAYTSGCPNLTKRKSQDGSGKSSQIDSYYNRIVNF